MNFDEVERKQLLVPCWCPVCGGLMKGKSTITWSTFGCCIDCKIWFLEDRPEKIAKWKAGWRPSPEEMAHYREMMKS